MRSSSIRSALPGLLAAALCVSPRTSIAQPPGDASADPAPAPPGADASAEPITPPRIVRAEDPTYPPARLSEGAHPTVVFLVVIDAEGHVRSADVEHTAGEDFDAAAREALLHWEFEPARRGATPIASRIRVSVHFELPIADLPTTDAHAHDVVDVDGEALESDRHVVHVPGDQPAPAREATDDLADASASAQVDVAPMRTLDRAASEVHLDGRSLRISPHRDAGEMMRAAPGVVVTRPEGDAVAHRFILRGFQAEHGQDIEFSVSGLPINQASHLHGQGYADLNFLIPEVVRGIRVREGIYDPTQGDFAVAGSADFELGTSRRGITLLGQGGSFRTFRGAVIVAPENEEDDTFVALDVRRSDGFGANRRSLGSSGLMQWGFDAGAWRLRLLGSLAASQAETAGVVRRDDQDEVGFYGVYDDPSARAQEARSGRALLGLLGERRAERGSSTEVASFLGFTDYRSRTNTTGYTQVSSTDPDVRGLGDLIEQRNQATTFGVRVRHRSARFAPSRWFEGHLEAGTSLRIDRTEQSQSLLAMPGNVVWDRRIDARIVGTDLGVFAEADVDLGRMVSVRAGARVDALFYDVEDALANPGSSVSGASRSAHGVAAGPRISVDVHPVDGLSVLAAYGEGFRSPQAILLTDGERAPIAKVRSADLGVRYSIATEDVEARVSASGFFTQVGDDLVFEAAENLFESLGPTRRVGAMIAGDVHALDLLDASASLTVVNATVVGPPPGEATEEPFVRGERIPYVPPVVLRADVGAHGELASLRGDALVGRIGAGVSFVGRRPLPDAQTSDPYALLDAQASLGWKGLELAISAQNLAGARYAASEYSFTSNWDPAAPTSRVPASQIAAGAPRTFLVTLSVTP